MLDHLARPESLAWHRRLAGLMRTAPSADFPRRLDQCLRELVPYETVLVNAYRDRRRPLLIHDDTPAARREMGIDRYLSEAYLLDPFFTAVGRGLDQGAHRLRELAPDRFEASDYYRRYYRALGLHDEVVFLARVDEAVVISVSLGFGALSPPLSRRAMRALRHLAPLVETLLAEYWTWQGGLFQRQLAEQEPVELAFASFGAGVLTAREQEIVRLMLAGHSAKSVARELAISDGTVKVHRKHVYRRLQVSSQSQLFRSFLDHVALVARRRSTEPGEG